MLCLANKLVSKKKSDEIYDLFRVEKCLRRRDAIRLVMSSHVDLLVKGTTVNWPKDTIQLVILISLVHCFGTTVHSGFK